MSTFKDFSNDVVIESFIEDGLLLSSRSHPYVNIEYPIRYFDTSITHMINSVENANLVTEFFSECYNIRKDDPTSTIYFYADGLYPFINNLRYHSSKIVIFTTEKNVGYYMDFYKFKDVYSINENELNDIYNVDDDNDSEILHYFVVNDNVKLLHDILNNTNKSKLAIQMNNSFMNGNEVLLNYNYNLIHDTYGKNLGYSIGLFDVKPEVMAFEL